MNTQPGDLTQRVEVIEADNNRRDERLSRIEQLIATGAEEHRTQLAELKQNLATRSKEHDARIARIEQTVARIEQTIAAGAQEHNASIARIEQTIADGAEEHRAQITALQHSNTAIAREHYTQMASMNAERDAQMARLEKSAVRTHVILEEIRGMFAVVGEGHSVLRARLSEHDVRFDLVDKQMNITRLDIEELKQEISALTAEQASSS